LPGTIGDTADEVTRHRTPCRDEVRPQANVDDLNAWKSPLFTGRVVAAFASTGEGLARTGQALAVDDLAEELGVNAADSPA
jgi:hypothetical protein